MKASQAVIFKLYELITIEQELHQKLYEVYDIGRSPYAAGPIGLYHDMSEASAYELTKHTVKRIKKLRRKIAHLGTITDFEDAVLHLAAQV